MSWYLHVDMDAFYVSVERALIPALKGKPVVVGGASGRGVVTSASYEARKFGVRSAMPAYRAKKICPKAIFLPTRRRIYSEYSRKVFTLLGQFSPEVRALSIDEGLVDLSGTERLLGLPLKTSNEIIKRIKKDLDLPSSGGLSTNRMVAKVAATLAKPQGLIYVPAGSERAFLSPLPIAFIPGIGPKSQGKLKQRGIKTVQDLLNNNQFKDRYLGLEEDIGGTSSHDHSISSETTLESPLSVKEEMEKVLWKLIEEVGGRLRKKTVYARCLTLKIRYTDFKTITRSKTLTSPTCFDREIFDVIRDLLNRNLYWNRKVRLLGVSASGLQNTGWQESIFEIGKRSSLEKLYQGIDQLRHRYGEEVVSAGSGRTHSR